MKNTTDESIRKAAEDNLATIISKSSSTAGFRSSLVTTYKNTPIDSVKNASLRLLGRVGGDQALAFVKECLGNPDRKTKMVALGALGNWVDSAGFNLIMETIRTEADLSNRAMAFDAAIKYASNTKDKPEDAWNKIATEAKIEEDQIKLINGLASYSADPWVYAILQNIIKTSDSYAAKGRAEKAINYLDKMKKVQGDTQKKDK
jgi:hypothetical protein